LIDFVKSSERGVIVRRGREENVEENVDAAAKS
jgi:hypothetical protein